MDVKYGCLKCRIERTGPSRMLEGSNCPECKAPMMPMRDESCKLPKKVSRKYEPRECKGCGWSGMVDIWINRCPYCEGKVTVLPPQPVATPVNIETKLDFLRELRQLEVRSKDEVDGRNAMIKRVCDSIEKDLHLKDFSVGDLTVKINVDDVSDFIDAYSKLSQKLSFGLETACLPK